MSENDDTLTLLLTGRATASVEIDREEWEQKTEEEQHEWAEAAFHDQGEANIFEGIMVESPH